MSIKVVNNIECFDTKHEAPRIITIQSSDKYNEIDRYIELHCDNHIYRVKAHELEAAITNATRLG